MQNADLDVIGVVAVNAIVTRLTGQLKPTKVINSLSEMRDNLDQDEASAYENGLALLGGFLGAESYKPDGPGRCDAAWLWDTAIWMTVEAKSEQDDED